MGIGVPAQSAGERRREELVSKLHARYRAPLLAFFQRRSASRAEAEDLTQEVFVRIVRRQDIAAPEAADALIFTIATNLLRDNIRRMRSRASDAHVDIDGHDHDGLDAGLVDVLSPERVLLSREVFHRVFRVLDGLNPRTRDVFVLFRLEGMRQREIAQLFGISVSAVEKHILKALAHLADEFRQS